jgi:hypothetical protein
VYTLRISGALAVVSYCAMCMQQGAIEEVKHIDENSVIS